MPCNIRCLIRCKIARRGGHIVGRAEAAERNLSSPVDLRLLGLSRDVSVSRLSRHALPWTVGAFLVAMFTGLLMFTAHAEDFLTNRVFALKDDAELLILSNSRTAFEPVKR